MTTRLPMAAYPHPSAVTRDGIRRGWITSHNPGTPNNYPALSLLQAPPNPVFPRRLEAPITTLLQPVRWGRRLRGILASYLPLIPPPRILSIAPATGPDAGGTPFTILGASFVNVLSVEIGGALATSVVVVAPDEITAVSPAFLPAGTTQDVSVTTTHGTFILPNAWTVPPITLTSATPNVGSTVGGDAITVHGTQFTGATAVTIGGLPVAAFSVVPGGLAIDVVTPGLAAAGSPYDIVVTTPSGSVTAVGGYSVSAAPPAPTAITPNSGTALVAHPVTIAGVPGAAHFTGADTGGVTIGGLPCTAVTVIDQNNLTCNTPAALAAGGPYDVVVTTPNGAGSLLAAYTAI